MNVEDMTIEICKAYLCLFNKPIKNNRDYRKWLVNNHPDHSFSISTDEFKKKNDKFILNHPKILKCFDKLTEKERQELNCSDYKEEEKKEGAAAVAFRPASAVASRPASAVAFRPASAVAFRPASAAIVRSCCCCCSPSGR